MASDYKYTSLSADYPQIHVAVLHADSCILNKAPFRRTDKLQHATVWNPVQSPVYCSIIRPYTSLKTYGWPFAVYEVRLLFAPCVDTLCINQRDERENRTNPLQLSANSEELKKTSQY